MLSETNKFVFAVKQITRGLGLAAGLLVIFGLLGTAILIPEKGEYFLLWALILLIASFRVVPLKINKE